MGIAIGSQYLEYFIFHCEKGHVKCSSTKIIHEHIGFFPSLINSISKGGSSWFVDNALYIQPCNCSCIPCCLALVIVEVGWNCHNSTIDFLP
mmetsp:Transcript_7583/g.13086  ORF Transcript_7583/g.13086 Transcript_7583/m.13086 type:complete len:92 (+) Transcript_7583:453-728(+)